MSYLMKIRLVLQRSGVGHYNTINVNLSLDFLKMSYFHHEICIPFPKTA